MRFQVPQFVDIEDRVIGPLTLKMFAYYAAAGLLLIPLYVLADLAVFITLGLPILGLAVLFAHVRIQGQSLALVAWYAATYFVSPKMYLWQRGGVPYPLLIRGPEYEEFIETGSAMAPSLEAIAEKLNTQGNVSELDEADPMLEEKPIAETDDQTGGK